MIMFAAVMLMAQATSVAAPSPDPKRVTSITEAVKLCGLDKTGIRWEETSADNLTLWVGMADMTPGSALDAPLKACIFPWAYERNVKLNVNLVDPASK